MKLRFGQTADLNTERKTVKFETHLHIFELLHLVYIFIHFYTMASFSIRATYVYAARLCNVLQLTLTPVHQSDVQVHFKHLESF